MKLTEPQRRALQCMADQRRRTGRCWVTPSEIGYAMTVDRKYPLKPQGAGRIGGTMAHRLIKLGFACNMSRHHSGFPAYGDTPAGRAALEASDE